MARHNELGKKGEQIAHDFLVKLGMTILDLNWRYLKAEIDIIFLDNDTLVLAEVKTRSTTAFGKPEEFVSHKKLSLYLDAAEAYLFDKKMDKEIRFDIVSIVFYSDKPIIKYIKDAF
jgi:putative endonuclease